MTPKKKPTALQVQDIEIALTTINGEDYISLTDMLKASDHDFFISDWLRNANTLDYLSAWETLFNPNFNYGEFATIRNRAGSNNFKISVKEWVERTNAIGITARAGRYGGTYAHKDIAFNFGMWISPQFQLYIVKEYQRLKDIEQNTLNLEWDARRELAKTNYRIHTDAIKEHMPKHIRKDKEWIKYAEEADIINQALFGCTAKEWQMANPQRHLSGENIRDSASINELIILSNLESQNATMIRLGTDKQTRLQLLTQIANTQRQSLERNSHLRSLKKLSETTYVDAKDNDKEKNEE